MRSAQLRAQPFFLPAEPGQRFGLFHPAAGEHCRGAVLYVHPFAEEMNKSRRAAALQARALADAGFAVLQVDLHGCGDSSGDFRDARWALWKADLGLACAWLAQRSGQPLTLWGLRLGALLALDYAQTASHPVARMVLWQPVQNGSQYLTQFLRLLSARTMIEGSAGRANSALREALLGGEMMEVAGYELAPELAAGIDGADMARIAAPSCPVDWFDCAASGDRPLTPAVSRQVAAWRAAGTEVQVHQVACAPFWSSQEIDEAAALVAATSSLNWIDADELSRASA